MFFPRKLSLRRKSQKPQDPARATDDELRPKLNLSKLELIALLLIR
jgi:hypothetical protein